MTLPGNLNSGELVSTSCSTPSFCMAVGSGTNQQNDSQALAYSWNGSNWTTQSSISSNGLWFPSSVSCAGLAFCDAAGGAAGTNVVMTWNGSSWSQNQSVPTPSGSNGLSGLSCFSTTSCTAVGGTSGGSQVLTWNGQAWTQVATHLSGLRVRPGTEMSGVDCLADWACVAAGSAFFGSGMSFTYQPVLASAPIARSGYYFVGSDGGIYNYGAAGSAPFLGSMGGTS